MILILFLGLLSSGCAEEIGGQTVSLPVVLVAPFDGSKTQIPCWSPAIGQAVSEMLIESLGNTDKRFQVLEASNASGQLNRIPTGESGSGGGAKPNKGAVGDFGKPTTGSGDNSQISDAGGSADSDFLLYGSVAEFGALTNSSKIGDFISTSPFANLGAKVVSARVQIDWRLVDAETKRVVTRGTAAGLAHGSEFDMSSMAPANGRNPSNGTNNQDAVAIGKTAASAKTAAAANTATTVKTAPDAKAAANGKGESRNLAIANNVFGGLSKAFDNSPAGTSGDNNNGNHSVTTGGWAGTTMSSSKTSLKAGGESGADESAIIGYDNSLFMNSALGKATAEAVTNIMKQLASVSLPESGRAAKLRTATDALKHTPGKVLAVAGKDTIIVSLGSKEGFKEGDQLELYQTNDVKDDKGNVVFTDEKPIGEITLSAVQEDRSRGSYSGDAQVQQGWIVKAK